jgi:hypothetical protein
LAATGFASVCKVLDLQRIASIQSAMQKRISQNKTGYTKEKNIEYLSIKRKNKNQS